MATTKKETKRQREARLCREEAETALREEAEKRDKSLRCPVCKTLRWIFYNGIACPNMCEGKIQKLDSELDVLRSRFPNLVVKPALKNRKPVIAVLDKYKKTGEYHQRVVLPDEARRSESTE